MLNRAVLVALAVVVPDVLAVIVAVGMLAVIAGVAYWPSSSWRVPGQWRARGPWRGHPGSRRDGRGGRGGRGGPLTGKSGFRKSAPCRVQRARRDEMTLLTGLLTEQAWVYIGNLG